jgi:hypothetical protein
MRSTKIGIVLSISLSFSLTSCWLTKGLSNSNKCNFAETDNEWVYHTSSNYEDGSYEADVKVTVTDTGAVEHYISIKRGMSAYTGCNDLMLTVTGTEENPRTTTNDKFTSTSYCKNSEYHAVSDYYYNFNAEDSKYKSRKELFDSHMKTCKTY